MSVIFQNPGIAPLVALTTMGVNAKENDSPIGFFGTGFKYAIATLLRHGAKIEIWLGTEKHELGQRIENVRNQDFSIVTLNGKDLGFSTMLGRNWQLWHAFRELQSNALDEGGDSTIGRFPGPIPGDTSIVVTDAEFEDIAGHKNLIFLHGQKPWTTGANAEIYPNNRSEVIYYRGVRISEPGMFPAAPLYTYNLLATQKISEDRLIANSHTMYANLGKHVACEVKNRGILEAIIGVREGTFEYQFEYSYAGVPTEEWLDVAETLFKSGKPMNKSAEDLLRANRASVKRREAANLTATQRENKIRAENFLATMGHNTDKLTIIPTSADKENGERFTKDYRNDEYLVPARHFNSASRAAAVMLEIFSDQKSDYKTSLPSRLADIAIDLAQSLHKVQL